MLIESVGIHCFRKTLRTDHNEVNGVCHEKYICLFLSTLMFLTIFSPVNCYARDGKKVIKVGFYTLANYQECDENGNYSGYFVDYLREISQYTGWEYEFIQMNYSACLKSLNDRNIDLVCGVDYSSFRTSTLDFSAQPAVTTHYELYALKDNDTYYYNDYVDFDGMSIGVLASCKKLDALDDYADAHHFPLRNNTSRTQHSWKKRLRTTLWMPFMLQVFPTLLKKRSLQGFLLSRFIL